MKQIIDRFIYFLILFTSVSASLHAFAQTTFTTGATSASSTTAILWFKPTASVGWVEAHYNTGAGQQNLPMNYNPSSSRYELTVNAVPGQTFISSFTYTVSGLAYDTTNQSITVSSTTSSAASSVASSIASSAASSSVASGIAIDVTDNGSSLVAWLKPNGEVVGWVEVHYTLNSDPQQNLRVAYSTSTGRYEQSIPVTAGIAAKLKYSFTYESSVGVKDSPEATYTRTVVSSSSKSSSSVVSVVSSSKSSSSVTSVASSSKSSSSIASVASSSVVSVASSSKSSSSATSVASSSKSSVASSVASSAVSSAASSDYSLAISEAIVGAKGNVTFKFTTSLTQPNPETAITFHYYLNGDTSKQDNRTMTYDSATKVWSYDLKSLPLKTVIYYSFTYNRPAVGGNWDGAWDNFKVGKDIGAIPKPTMSPAPGVYSFAQQVSLTADSDATIYYTIDGTSPTPEKGIRYSSSSPINVTAGHGVWIQAIAVSAKGTSYVGEGGYSIEVPITSLESPEFSHPSNTYSTVIRPTISHPIEGVEVYYTTNGQDPEPITGVPVLGADGKPINKTVRYTKALEIFINTDHPDGRWQVKAIAVKNGVKSPVKTVDYLSTTASYKSDWSGKTIMKVVNKNTDKWKDSEVYWAIIGKDWATGDFVWIDKDGKQVKMLLDDSADLKGDSKVSNTTPTSGKTYVRKSGDTNKYYANYFHKLSELSQVQIDAIDSARMMVSYGSPMYIVTNKVADPASADYGKTAYAGANVEAEGDPSRDVYFDFMEFALVPKTLDFIGGIFINNTRVDMFGFPVQVSVTGLDGFKQTVGESFRESRADIFARFKAEATPEFGELIKAYDSTTPPFRIMAPAHDVNTFGVIWEDKAKTIVKEQGVYHDYYDSYIKAVWEYWKANEMTLALDGGWTFKGRVNSSNQFEFHNVDPITDPATDPGVYKILGIPSTQDVFLGNGLLDDNRGQNPAPKSIGRMKQLQIQAQVCAAINRHVAHLDPTNWHNAALFFPKGEVSNWYDKLSRAHSLEALSYGFAYSDVGEQSSSIYTWSPDTVTFTVGW